MGDAPSTGIIKGIIFASESITRREAQASSPGCASRKRKLTQPTHSFSTCTYTHYIHKTASIPRNDESADIKMTFSKHFPPRSGQFKDDDQHRILESNATPIAHPNGPALTPEITGPALPWLQTHVRRKWLFGLGIVVAVFDLCVMPNVYFYGLKFGSKLTLQDSMFCPQNRPI